jgi:hypothetical protein
MKGMLGVVLFLFISGAAFAAPGQTHYVKPLQATIYEKASSSSKEKFVVAIGRKLIEFERRNGFIHVGVDKAGGRSGWIRANDVSATDPDGMRY